MEPPYRPPYLPKECLDTDPETAYRFTPDAIKDELEAYLKTLKQCKTFISTIDIFRLRFMKSRRVYVNHATIAGWLRNDHPDTLHPQDRDPTPFEGIYASIYFRINIR